MAVLSKEEFLSTLKAKVGEDTSDESIKFLEDMSDTYNHLESVSQPTEDWKAKYDELDASWRKKYTDRFFSSETDEDVVPDKTLLDGEGDNTPKKFDDLFISEGE